MSLFFSLNANGAREWFRHRWKDRNQLLYGPDLVPNNFLLFELLKKHFTAVRFATDADLKQAVTSRQHPLCANTLYAGVK